jgi:phosphoribosyl 1,2-cyclic phosphodiesterase
MREACMAHFPKHNVEAVDAIILTHGHSDAILGLDDVRDFQRGHYVSIPNPDRPDTTLSGYRIDSGPLRLFGTEMTLQRVREVFPYFTDSPKFLDEAKTVLERRVAAVELCPIPERQSLVLNSLHIECFPAYHGGTYVSLGFGIGRPGDFIYISDVKYVPSVTMEYLKSLPRIKVFVIDCLSRDGIWSHMGFYEAIEFCKQLNPEQIYFTGIYYSSFIKNDS